MYPFAYVTPQIYTIFAFKRCMLPDGDLYKELTYQYQCRTIEDIMSRAWTQVKLEEYSTYQIKRSQKKESRAVRNEKSAKDEKTYHKLDKEI